MVLNPPTKEDFRSSNPYFYCIQPRNILKNYNIIRDLSRFLQPVLISSTIFNKKLGYPTANHEMIYKIIAVLTNSL